jgi:two-component system, sensor histidine kinase and response regulator
MTMEQPNHILIVDDVPENIQLLGSMLQRRGYRVSLAENGPQALESVAVEAPHLILLDISMPDMDGFEVCAKLKESSTTRDIPIIFLSAFSDKERVVQGFDIGAVDYVTKPFNSAELYSRIRTHLDLRFTKDLLMLRNQQLQELNEQLYQFNNDKDELLGIVAHDLKNPLSAIRGISETLVRDTTLTASETIDMQQSIMETADRMFALITDLLSANALERGGIQLRIVPVDVSDIIQQTLYSYHKAATKKSITLEYHHTSGLLAFTDERSLIHIIDNLLSNAIKYSPLGKSVFVKVQQQAASIYMPHGSVRVEIKDEGQGMTEEDLSKIFSKFTRLSAKPTAGEHSTGLGLSIAKKLSELINARIWCESVYGHGTTFVLELPAITARESEEFGV